MEAVLRRRIAQLHQAAPGSIGDILQFSLLEYDPETGDCLMSCRTADWMCNPAGTLHGGLCATVLDQAMGYVAFCLKPDEGTAPTVQLSVNYHRPLMPGKEILVRVRVISVSKSLISLSSEAWDKEFPRKLCLSGTGLYFVRQARP